MTKNRDREIVSFSLLSSRDDDHDKKLEKLGPTELLVSDITS